MSLLIYLAEVTLGMLRGVSLGNWGMFGDSMEEAVTNSGHVFRVATWLAKLYLYYLFANGLAGLRFLNVLAVFAMRLMIDLPVSTLAFGMTMTEFFDPEYIGQEFLLAMLGLGLASIGSRWSFKRRSLAQGD
jgi:hypothetical protein